MTNSSIQQTKIGRQSVVVVPLKEWERITETLEDHEALSSQRYLKSIARARAEVKRGEVVPFEEILEELG